MREIIDVMQDVSVLVARGSDAARIEAQRVAANRQCRTAENGQDGAEQPATAGGQSSHPLMRFVGWLPRAWPRRF